VREGRDRVEGHTSLGHTGVDTHRCFALAASKPRSRRDRVHGSARRRAAPSAAGPAAHPRGQESALSVRAHPRWMAAAGEMAMHIATPEPREEGRRRTDRGDGGGAARPGRRSRRRRLKASPRSGMNLTFRCPGQPRLGTPRGGRSVVVQLPWSSLAAVTATPRPPLSVCPRHSCISRRPHPDVPRDTVEKLLFGNETPITPVRSPAGT
jgi:hypothetical protein